jgi:diguanylate cyclase (GGDEF)-like protein
MIADVATHAHSPHKFRVLSLGGAVPVVDHLIRSLAPEFVCRTMPEVSAESDLSKLEADVFILPLNDASALSIFSTLRVMPVFQDVPIIFVTHCDSGDKEEAVINLGAADVLHVPCHRGVARARLRACLRVANRLRRLTAMSGVDSITRLPSKRSFMQQIERELGRAKRLQRPLSLVVFELSGPGHRKTRADTVFLDRVVSQIALTLEFNLNRTTDFACRYRPDQVLLVLPETDESGARQVAPRLCRAINRTLAEPSLGGGVLRVRYHVSSCTPGRMSTAAGMLREALLASGEDLAADIKDVERLQLTS